MTRRTVSIRIAALAAVMTVLAAGGCDSLPGRPRAAQRPIRPSQVSSFDVLYRQNCAGCHGANGQFGASLPMNNPTYMALIDDAGLRRAIAQGVPGTAMPAFAPAAGGDLTDAQIAIVIQGMRRRWGGTAGAAMPSYAGTSQGDPAQGRRDFQTYCASCHGPGGKAGAVVTGTYLTLVSNQYLRTLIIAGRPDLRHPDWRGYGVHPLTETEVTDLVAWLAAQRPDWNGGRNAANSRG